MEHGPLNSMGPDTCKAEICERRFYHLPATIHNRSRTDLWDQQPGTTKTAGNCCSDYLHPRAGLKGNFSAVVSVLLRISELPQLRL